MDHLEFVLAFQWNIRNTAKQPKVAVVQICDDFKPSEFK